MKDEGIIMKRSGAANEETLRVNDVKTEDASYKYTLCVTKSDRVASYRLPLYSIRIEMWTSDGYYTEARTGDIFSDLGKAVVFYERMVENLATPINLAYIVEDTITP